MKQLRIALFGGTFDPIHQGHTGIAARAVEALGLDQVIFLPCRTSPHKIGIHTAPAADRLAMVSLAIAGLPWAVVDDFDLQTTGPAYSFLTAEEMAARHSGARLYWLMGADQWRALPEWAEPDRLAATVEFIVFSRDGSPAPAPRPGWRMHRVAGTSPASATAIREALRQGTAPGDWLAPAVAAYIRKHALYGTQGEDNS